MQKIRTIISIAFVLMLFVASASAQTDNEFWFAAPEVSTFNGMGGTNDRPIYLYITTYGQKAKITVSQPAAGITLTTVNVPANGTRGIDLTPWINSIESMPANTVLQNGLLITSTAPVTAYYEVVSGCQCNPEIFVLKGKNALGTDFWIPSQNVNDNASVTASWPAVSSFDIVATENNTTVTITPTKDIIGHTGGSTFNITLNRGEVYSATATSRLAADHLPGSRVLANRPVAVTVKDDEVWLGPGTCADLLGDQIVPTNLVGREYIAIKGRLTYDLLFVTATQSNTTVFQDGAPAVTLNAGQTHMLKVVDPTTFVQATNPVYIWQVTGIGCEFGATVLPALGCTGSYAVSFTRSTQEELIINLLTKAGGQSTFLVNGIAGVVNSTDFFVVPGTNNQYYAAQITLPVSNYPPGKEISITNSAMMFHLGVLNGKSGTGTRYGYFSNYGNIAPIVWTNSPICENDSLNLYTHKITGAQYTWSGPNNFTSKIPDPFMFPVSFAASGPYTLKMDANGCSGTSWVDLVVNPKPILNVTPNISYLCPTDSMRITVSGADSFEWFPAYAMDTNKGPSVKVSPDVTTTYFVVGMGANECKTRDSARVNINQVPGVVVTPDSIVICPNSSVQLTAKGATSYSWTPTTGLNAITGSTVISMADESTMYVVTGKAQNGCFGRDTAWVVVDDTVYSDIDVIICPDSNLVFGDTIAREIGSYVQNFRTLMGCDSIVTLHLTHKIPPVADFTYTPVVPVMNEPTQFINGSTGAASYHWDFGDKSFSEEKDPKYLFKRTGTYTVCLTARSEERCPDIICKEVDAEIYPNVSVPDAFSPNGDGINDLLRLYGGAVQEVVFRVYNRWGQVVFETRDMNTGWDGTIKGIEQDAEVFAYTLYAVFIDGTVYKKNGNITLIK